MCVCVLFADSNRTLEIKNAVYTRDTGAYKCKARNSAGVGQDIATVFIENSHVPTYQSGEEGLSGEHASLPLAHPADAQIKHNVNPMLSVAVLSFIKVFSKENIIFVLID